MNMWMMVLLAVVLTVAGSVIIKVAIDLASLPDTSVKTYIICSSGSGCSPRVHKYEEKDGCVLFDNQKVCGSYSIIKNI